MTKKESKSSGNKGVDDKAGSSFIVGVVVAVVAVVVAVVAVVDAVVVLYCNDCALGIKLVISTSEKQFLILLDNGLG